jgi:hypothetical protein
MRTRIAVTALAMMCLLAATGLAPTESDGTLLPRGSVWTGKRTTQDDSFTVRAHVVSHADNSVILNTNEENGHKLQWSFTLTGTKLQLDSLRLLEGGGKRKDEWANGVVVDNGDEVRIEYGWTLNTANKKNVPVKGQMLLKRARDLEGKQGKGG